MHDVQILPINEFLNDIASLPLRWMTGRFHHGHFLARLHGDYLTALSLHHAPLPAWMYGTPLNDSHPFAEAILKLELPAPARAVGTEFQQKVWERMLQIPRGSVMTYGQIAQDLGMPKTARAVGGAVGSNELAIVVPCHRVVPHNHIVKNGQYENIGHFKWGAPFKATLLKLEGQAA